MRLLLLLYLLLVIVIPARAPAENIDAYLRGYPRTIPADVSFDTVVSSQPFPAMKYAVPIIGWKHHPEEVHVTPSGALVFPRPGRPAGIYLAPLICSTPNGEPAVLDIERVSRNLVDGYMPGIRSKWSTGGLGIAQLAFCTLLDGNEVKTGREPLVAFTRYTIKNPSNGEKKVSLWLNFGEAVGGVSMRQPPIAYGKALTFDGGFVSEPTGDVEACLLTKGLNPSFHQVQIALASGRSRYTIINETEAAVPGRYEFSMERSGDAITVNGWKSSNGVDLHLEASLAHNLPVAVDISFVDSDGKTVKAGRLFKTGLYTEMHPASESIYRGQHSVPVTWSQLAKYVPQGKCKVVMKSMFPVGEAWAEVNTWEPIIYLGEPGALPSFKRPAEGGPKQNSLEIALALKPGQSKSIDLAVPYYPLARLKAAALRNTKLDDRLAQFRKFWSEELNRTAQFVVPEKRIQDSYRMCLANNLMLVDKDPQSGLLLPHPDPTAYEAVWAGDSGVIIDAMDRLGYHKEAEGYLNFFLAKQGTRMPDGEATDCKGFFTGDAIRWMSENGFILWAMAEHYNLTGDKVWLKKTAPKLIESADWIVRQRKATKVPVNGEKPRHFGLMPKGAPSDIGVWDYWYWTDTYSYMGLRKTADALRDIGMKDEADRLSAEAEDYRSCIVDSVERSINMDSVPPYFPASPYTNGKPSAELLNSCWYSICSPIYMVEAGLFGAKSQEAGWVLYWLEKYGLYTGLPAFGGGSIDPHYVYNQSLAHLLRGETDKFDWTFYSLFAYGQSRDTYATIEGQNLVAGNIGDSWNVYRQPHMHSNSRVLDMVRISMVLEDGKKLHLLAGTPRGWLANGKTIEVKRAATDFGDISVKAVSNVTAGEIVVVVQPPTRESAEIVLHVRPPSRYGTIKSVAVNGKPWSKFNAEQVELGKLEGQATVVCRF